MRGLISSGLLLAGLALCSACGSDSKQDEVDLCADHACGDAGYCAVVFGEPICVCDPGYSGEHCEVPPLCDPNPCTSAHQTVCAEVSGQAVCLCDEGYHEDGVGGCAPAAAGPCADDPCNEPHRTICAVISGVEVCLCDEGYLDDGTACVPLPDGPCDPNPCQEQNRTVCEPVGDTAVCRCVAGYHDEGGSCVADDPCQPNPCDEPHRSVCVDVFGVARCDCDEGYIDDGQSCLPEDPCQPNPCDEPHRSVCVADGDQARCECDEGYIDDLASGGCVPDQAPGCQDSHTSGDSYEPDECAALATALEPAVSQDHTIEPAGDNDWFSLAALAGQIYRFTADESACDLYVHLYDQDGITVLRAHDTASFTYELPASGTYYYRVRAYSANATGSYTVTVTDEGLDDHGDDAASATPLTVDGPQLAGDIETWEDDDWFSFTGQAGHIYTLSATQTAVDLYVYLYDADGTSVLSARDDATVTYRLASSGTYYFRVRAYSSTATGSYEVTLTDEGFDDHGDDAATASPLTAGASPLAGSIETWGDNDWFSLAAQAGQIYRFTADETSLDLFVTLYDSDGTTALRSHDTADFTYELPADGTYFLRVRAYSATATGSYTVSVVDEGPDDHGDASTAATPLIVDGPALDGAIETWGDNDWFSFSAQAGHIYRLAASEASLDLYVYLYDTDGQTVLRGQDTASFAYELPAAGTYYYRVRAYSDKATGPYTVSVTDEGLDDHGDDTTSATPLSTDGTAMAGAIETAGDTDWFSFQGTGGVAYQVTISGINSHATIFTADGQTIVGGSSLASFGFTPETSSTYYLRVRHTLSSGTGSYTLTIQD